MKLLKITAALLLLLTPLASLSARADGQSDLDQARARRLGAAEKERAVVVESLNKAESNLQELVGQRHRLQEIANLIDKRGNAYDLLLKEISRVNGRILVLSHERDVIGNDFDAWNGVIVDLRKQVVVLEPAANGDLRPVPFQEKRLPDLKYPSWLRPSTGSGKAAFVGGR